MVNQCDYIMDARGVAQKFKDEAARAEMRQAEMRQAEMRLARANQLSLQPKEHTLLSWGAAPLGRTIRIASPKRRSQARSRCAE